MRQYPENLTIGEFLDTVCENMVKEAKRVNDFVFCDFNGIQVIATPTSNSYDLMKEYKRKMERLNEAYQNSPEGLAAKKRSEDEVARMQEELNQLVPRLFNAGSIEETLAILKEIQPLTDRVGVKKPIGEIVKVFKDQGYVAGMNTNENFKIDDKENFAGYIIGQCLSMLENVGAIHSCVIRFINEWEARFKN